MYRFRFLVVILMVWLAIHYAVQFFQPFYTMPYLPSLLAFFSVFLLLQPRITKRYGKRITGLTIAGYIIIRLIFAPEIYPSLLINLALDSLAIGITALLVLQITDIISDYEASILSITVNATDLSPKIFKNNLEEMYRELRRARRFDSEVAVAIIEPNFSEVAMDMNTIVLDIQRGMAARYMQATLINSLAEQLRDSDLIFDNNDAVIIAMPNTSEAEAHAMLNNCSFKELGALPISYGLSSFPSKATTFHAILEDARMKLFSGQAIGTEPPENDADYMPHEQFEPSLSAVQPSSL